MIDPNCPNRCDTSLSLLGPLVAGFNAWLIQQDYRVGTIRLMLSCLKAIDRWLRENGIEQIADLDAAVFDRGWKRFYRRSTSGAGVGATIRALARYLTVEGIILPAPPPRLTPTLQLLKAYEGELSDLRGFACSTVTEHLRSATYFLEYLGYGTKPCVLKELGGSDVEAFVRISAVRFSRGTQQHVVGHLRSFLRFLAASELCSTGLDSTIDTPRCYRNEQLPRALPWDTVQALLASIDQTMPIGLRDYTMLFLIATYGLRVSEITALSFDDIHWREGWIEIPQSKTSRTLRLPLTDNVGAVLVQYLRSARPETRNISCRALFLRSRAPLRALCPTTVSMAFERWAKRSGLSIPFSGAHCLRHAYAVRLLNAGTSLKTIGDLLGHRDNDSTCVYLHMAVDTLREVALSVPALTHRASSPEK